MVETKKLEIGGLPVRRNTQGHWEVENGHYELNGAAGNHITVSEHDCRKYMDLEFGKVYFRKIPLEDMEHIADCKVGPCYTWLDGSDFAQYLLVNEKDVLWLHIQFNKTDITYSYSLENGNMYGYQYAEELNGDNLEIFSAGLNACKRIAAEIVESVPLGTS
jgi:hypothetical protein